MRNFQKTLKICNEYKNTNIIDDSWILWVKGRNALALNQRELATSYFDSIRLLWTREQQTSSDNWNNHRFLSVAYAGMGLKEKFLEEVELVETLMPLHKDALLWTRIMVNKIELLIWLGEYIQAIDLADQMLSLPSRLTINSLRLSPIYDPLRDNPRFQELIAKYEEKG